MNLPKASPSAMDGLIPNPKARLFDQVREVMRFKHYSVRTEQVYLALDAAVFGVSPGEGATSNVQR